MEYLENKNKLPTLVGGFICLCAVLVLIFSVFNQKKQEFGASVPTQIARYALFTTSTLTNAYTGSGAVSTTGRLAKSFGNVAFSGVYQSNTTGAKAMILLERSLDDGVTYQPYQTMTPETADVLINTSGSGTSSGSPFIIPGTGASASGTNPIPFSWDLSLAADYVRVSVKEVSSSTGSVLVTPGTITLRTLFTSL